MHWWTAWIPWDSIYWSMLVSHHVAPINWIEWCCCNVIETIHTKRSCILEPLRSTKMYTHARNFHIFWRLTEIAKSTNVNDATIEIFDICASKMENVHRSWKWIFFVLQKECVMRYLKFSLRFEKINQDTKSCPSFFFCVHYCCLSIYLTTFIFHAIYLNECDSDRNGYTFTCKQNNNNNKKTHMHRDHLHGGMCMIKWNDDETKSVCGVIVVNF